MEQSVLPLKDELRAHPVPDAWKGTLCSIVRAFLRKDFCLSAPITGVDPVADEVASQIEEFISDYGVSLIELPHETWNSSCAQWMGDRWNVLVDLWSEEEGRSDLVLECVVTESNEDFRFKVHLVYVP